MTRIGAVLGRGKSSKSVFKRGPESVPRLLCRFMLVRFRVYENFDVKYGDLRGRRNGGNFFPRQLRKKKKKNI